MNSSPPTPEKATEDGSEVVLKRRLRDLGQHVVASSRNGKSAASIVKQLWADVDDLRRATEAPKPRDTFTFHDLAMAHPNHRAVLIDGLARVGDVLNVIASSKVGKSWFVYYLALCIITQRYLFGRFATTGGKVLICDNELHAETLAARIPVVAAAMGVAREDYDQRLVIKILRGNLRSFGEVASEIREQFEPGEFALIVFDAKYRFAQPGQSENDNANEAMFYNEADRFAGAMQAAVAFVHHATKGNQSDKRASDVGAGAGAQSRAADVHAIFREHEDDGAFVFEALVRSFAPIEPIGLRWMFPLWVPDSDVDTAMLKGRLKPNEQRQNDRDREGISLIASALLKGPTTPREIRRLTSLGPDRLSRLLDKLESDGKVSSVELKVRGNVTREYTLLKDESTTSDE